MNTIAKVVVALILVGLLGGAAEAQYRQHPHQARYYYVPVPVSPYYSGYYPTLAQYQMYQLQQYQLMQQQWQYQQQLQQQYVAQH